MVFFLYFLGGYGTLADADADFQGGGEGVGGGGGGGETPGFDVTDEVDVAGVAFFEVLLGFLALRV